MIARAGLGASEAEAVNVVDDVAGCRFGRKDSSSVDNAGMALAWRQASADMDTIAVGVAADNGAVEEDVGRDVGRAGTCAAYEDGEEALVPDNGFHAVACRYEEEPPAEHAHGGSSSRAGKPRGLLVPASRRRRLSTGFLPRHG